MSLISVIIPNRNRPVRARRAVESVLEQEGVEFELLVVDDKSDQVPTHLYEEIEEKGHQVLRRTTRLGPGAARNQGVKSSRGEWLAFLDSDDHWLPGKLAHQLAGLQRSGLEIGQVEEIWYRDGQRVNPPKAHKISGGDLWKRSLRSVCVSSSSVMLSRSLWEQAGGFDEELFVCEDYELWLRVAARAEFDFCPEPLVVKFGGHQDQLSKALPAMDRFRILGLVKNLAAGNFNKPEMAQAELSRKLRILSKGSAKRGMDRVVELCQQIEDSRGDWNLCLELGRKLMTQWDTRPD